MQDGAREIENNLGEKSKKDPCYIGNGSDFDFSCISQNKKNILLLGDSHLGAWATAFNEVFSHQASFLKLAYFKCHYVFVVDLLNNTVSARDIDEDLSRG